jgi:AraC family transcriptional regulator of adaptative response/methylated-DNA-[protein]-cysteine methyltransferase
MLSRQKNFYAAMLRAPKAAAKPKRRKEVFRYAAGRCALGHIIVAASADGVVAVMIRAKASELVPALRQHFPKVELRKDDDEVPDMLERIIAYIDAPAKPPKLALDLRGTPFQRRVWQAVQNVPAGKLATYSDIAEKTGAGKAVREVGSSCTKCPISILVPCHRIVHKGATTLEAAAQGSPRKRAFLEWDQKAAGKKAR